jgi:hypothetical protein
MRRYRSEHRHGWGNALLPWDDLWSGCLRNRWHLAAQKYSTQHNEPGNRGNCERKKRASFLHALTLSYVGDESIVEDAEDGVCRIRNRFYSLSVTLISSPRDLGRAMMSSFVQFL